MSKTYAYLDGAHIRERSKVVIESVFRANLSGHLKTGHKWTVQNRPAEWESGQEYLYPDGADFGKIQSGSHVAGGFTTAC